MTWRRLSSYLLPKEEENDPRFRRELDELSVIGLRVIAGVSIGGPLFSLVAGLTWAPQVFEFFRVEGMLGILLVGWAALALTFWQRASPYARLLGIVVGYLVFFFSLFGQTGLAESVYLIPANFMMIMLVGIASLPIKPLQVAGLGLAILGTYTVSAPMIHPTLNTSAQLPPLLSSFMQILLICVALTAVVYHQRVTAYRARRSAEESFEELRQAQSRLLMSENAASQGRFAAALSHELNSPMGALTSALDTLLTAYEKLESHYDQVSRLKAVIMGATSSAKQSSQRMMETMDRMKHLTNLDRAEEQVVDLNELWESTSALLHGELERKAEVTLTLESLPRIPCRPQQMSAVFSNLLRNAADSIEEDGTIRVTSIHRGSDIVLEVRDNGRGIPEDRLPHLFDPSFRVEGSRVSTSNWGLFISRSIIIEHGGQLEIDSAEGRGTTARIVLPVKAVVTA
jgi:signal transduction histidine kinase